MRVYACVQLVPFPFDLVQRELRRYPNAEFLWCQEEPMNMGGYTHICPRLETCMRNEDRQVCCSHPAACDQKGTEKKRKRKTTPVGVTLLRSQVLHGVLTPHVVTISRTEASLIDTVFRDLLHVVNTSGCREGVGHGCCFQTCCMWSP